MSKPRFRTIALGVSTLLPVGILLSIVTVGTRTIMSCPICRAERVDRTLFGVAWQASRNTEFTEWYHAHGPKHEHTWGRESCTVGYSLLGTTTYFACGGGHPVCAIPNSALLEYCERSDPAEVSAYFEAVRSANPEIQARAVQMVNESPIWQP